MFKHSDKIILSADIGGSHVTTGLIHVDTLEVIPGSIRESRLDAKAGPDMILNTGLLPAFDTAIQAIADFKESYQLAGLAIAIPGPFDYQRGIFRLSGLDKYGNLYGVDFKRFLYDRLPLDPALPVFFKNDADCFGLGAYATHVGEVRVQELEDRALASGLAVNKMIGITLGTGLGSAFVEDGQTLEGGKEVPEGGHLYNQQLQFSMKTADFENVDLQEGLFSYGMSEELISTRGLLHYVNNRVFDVKTDTAESKLLENVKDLAVLARSGTDALGEHDKEAAALAVEAFKVMGFGLGSCLKPWFDKFKPATLVLGGGIAEASDLFLPSLKRAIGQRRNPAAQTDDPPALSGAADSGTAGELPINIVILDKQQMQVTPLIGAAYALKQSLENNVAGSLSALDKMQGLDVLDTQWRGTHQSLLPKRIDEGLQDAVDSGKYNIFPFHNIGKAKIKSGFEGLARQLLTMSRNLPVKAIALDGYSAVDWAAMQAGLSVTFKALGLSVLWMDMASFARASQQIERLIEPYIGKPGSVWGTKTELHLTDLFDHGHIKTSLTPKHIQAFNSDLVIFYGPGAGLAMPDIPVAYVELPKNEIQYRMRAGRADNLLTSLRPGYADQYKRAYFVDWPMLDDYRQRIAPFIKVSIDAQWRTDINWILQEDLTAALQQLSQAPLRVRPWFAPGAWGGDWMKTNFKQLSPMEVNYAWSFELIVPENGIVLESDGLLLEIPFDLLMFSHPGDILGEDQQYFGHYFPIRFDFLDTFNGGNLSIQCHPSLPYIKEHFGEMITQDETYYILDAQPGAGVYLGFQEGIEPESFKAALELSQQENKALDIEQYVQLLPAKKHDLFLIPNQTIHSAGVNNLVLEISATPYIFTFKMYDWVRPDLNGKPRPINIEHAFHNLDFSRKGEAVQEELVSIPELIDSGKDYELWDLPTHPEHFYGIHRLEFLSVMEASQALSGKCKILMVVEGPGVILELPDGSRSFYSYAETFIIPAAVTGYRLIHPEAATDNKDNHQPVRETPDAHPDTKRVKVVQAFIR